MTTYRLLAHAKDATQALVQHDGDQVAYLYKFEEPITTYTSVPSEHTVDQETWETNYPFGNVFESIPELQQYTKGHAAASKPRDSAITDE